MTSTKPAFPSCCQELQTHLIVIVKPPRWQQSVQTDMLNGMAQRRTGSQPSSDSKPAQDIGWWPFYHLAVVRMAAHATWLTWLHHDNRRQTNHRPAHTDYVQSSQLDRGRHLLI